MTGHKYSDVFGRAWFIANNNIQGYIILPVFFTQGDMCQPICATLVAADVLTPNRCQVIYSDHVDSTVIMVT